METTTPCDSAAVTETKDDRMYSHADVSTDYVMMIVHSVIASVGITGNLTVVIVLSSDKKLRYKVPNIFIINQSLIDLSASIFLLLSTVTQRNSYHVSNDGVLGFIECALWNSRLFLWGLFVASTWNLVALTMERYLELIHPLWHKAHFKMKWVYVTTVLCWCFGIGLNASYMIPTSQVIDGECYVFYKWPCAEVKTAFGVALIFIQFFIPLIILIYCYGRILHMLSNRLNVYRTDMNISNCCSGREEIPCTTGSDKKTSAVTVISCSNVNLQLSSNNNNASCSSQIDNKFQIARRNTIRTLLIVGLCFIICWSNNQVYYLMHHVGYSIDWNGTYYQFTVLMVFLNCIINPFIYLIKYEDYQLALKRFLHRD